MTNGRIAHELKLEGTTQAGKKARGKQGLMYGGKRKPQMPASRHSEKRAPYPEGRTKENFRRAHNTMGNLLDCSQLFVRV